VSMPATGLDKLTAMMSDEIARAVRLGYALGYLHGQAAREPDIPAQSPSFRALEALGVLEP
jgi:hypothetical protein